MGEDDMKKSATIEASIGSLFYLYLFFVRILHSYSICFLVFGGSKLDLNCFGSVSDDYENEFMIDNFLRTDPRYELRVDSPKS